MIKKLLAFLFCIGSYSLAIAQTEISGLIFDEYLEPFPGAIVKTSEGKSVSSDYDGVFTIKIKKFPVTINVSLVGYQTETIILKEVSEEINVILKESFALDQIVISASRTPERIMESPVSIERVGLKGFKSNSSPNFYEGLGNLKGIDILSNSFNIKNIVSNRGFANTENTRFVQIADGTETTVPFINYSLGNLSGLNELDVASVEVLPGAASALYGANALNGILLMTSKNPFDYKGISTYFKTGVTRQDKAGQNEFYDLGIRMAHAFNNKIAIKTNFSYSKGEEWHATDYRNTTEQGGVIIEGNRNSDPGYDGLNVYGDEIEANLKDLIVLGETLFPSLVPPGSSRIVPDVDVSRIGYNEVDLIDNKTKSLTFDGSFYYRPKGNEDLEIIWNSKYNLADNIIHGSNRYVQKGGLMQQHRLEFKAKNFFVRGYYTQNNANLVDPRLTGIFINNSFKNDQVYFTEYALTYLGTLVANPGNTSLAFSNARALAESNRPEVGSPLFRSLVNQASKISVNDGGASLKDETGFYHVDTNYNLRNIVDFADIQVGGSFRRFILNSNGELYNDKNGSIRFNEFGAYGQIQKKLSDNRLKLTGTIRYDKSQNFKGNLSPRASISYVAGSTRDHNFRVAFQTGFRNPTTQDQYASVSLGDRTILGSVEDNIISESASYPIRGTTGLSLVGPLATISGVEGIKDNSYTNDSRELFLAGVRENVGNGDTNAIAVGKNAGLLEKALFDFVKPETVQSFEFGYRGATKLADKLFEFDVAVYYNIYNDFITQKTIWTPLYGKVDNGTTDFLAPIAVLSTDVRRHIIRTNTSSKVESYGLNAGFVTKVFGGYSLGANYAYSTFSDDGADANFKNAFNTPEHKVKIQFGHDKLFKNFGFNINARWQDEFLYQSVFIDALIEERIVFDGQINYTFPSIKSTFKLGGTNLSGKDYTSVPGTGNIGTQYYVSWTINN